jgi:hypothetical protein
MDAETPSRGRDRTVDDQGFAPERKRTFHQRHLTGLDLGGMTPFQWNASLGRLSLHLHHDVIQLHAFGGRLGSSGTCGMLERPLGG